MPRVQGWTGAANVQEVRTGNCSCISCTPTIHGGRMPRVQGWTGAANVQEVRAAPSHPCAAEVQYKRNTSVANQLASCVLHHRTADYCYGDSHTVRTSSSHQQ
jgi:hypothetical protein